MRCPVNGPLLPQGYSLEKLLGTVGEYDCLNDLLENVPAVYAYMIYLRHHGFPSPLLDWTRSRYIAAFFAFKDLEPSDGNRSIFVFGEPKSLTLKGEGHPIIDRLGPNIRSDRRHFLQQGMYTVSMVFEEKEWRFAPYPDQETLWKFSIPSTERLRVLERLDDHILNAFSLFGTEDSLMETMALRELNCRA